jgi:hypothetical protein
VAVVGAGWSELTEFVTDHILSHIHRDMLRPIVHCKSQPEEIGKNGGSPTPGLNHLTTATFARNSGLLKKVLVDEGSLLD